MREISCYSAFIGNCLITSHTTLAPSPQVDEFIPLFPVLLKEMRMLGESKVHLFLSSVNQGNAEVG